MSIQGIAREFSLAGARAAAVSVLLILAMLPLSTQAQAQATDDHAAVAAVLDDFHAAAAEADAARYLGHFAEGGVFLGTDDWERWPLPVFRDYVAERFASGGWAYTPATREIAFAADVAWFDEIVVSERWGRFRGTGVLRREQGGWKIAHYALSFLVPNERWEEVARSAQQGFEARKAVPERP